MPLFQGRKVRRKVLMKAVETFAQTQTEKSSLHMFNYSSTSAEPAGKQNQKEGHPKIYNKTKTLHPI